MGIPTLLLFALFAQDPSPAPRLDVITLKNGESIEGRVVARVDGYIEIELGSGATVGFAAADVKSIAAEAARAPQPRSGVQPRDDWFVLHDGAGAAVGWLHTSIGNDGDGLRLVEEWEFAIDGRRVAVTALETAGADWLPRTSYWHERVTEPAQAQLLDDQMARAERVREERIVEARCAGQDLQLQRITGTTRQERTLPLPAGTTFPLLAQAQLRCGGQPADELIQRMVFDPATEELAARSYQPGRRRTVQIDGKVTVVTELASTTAAGRSAEWLDASSRTLRREIAGPSLVAVPSSEASARAAALGGSQIAAALVADATSSLGLWLPNPAWLAPELRKPGQVSVEFPLHAARCSLLQLDQLPADATLSTAADALRRWFVLLHPELDVAPASPAKVRNCTALRMTAEGKDAGRVLRAELFVIAVGQGYVALVCTAPKAHWDELGNDFAALLRTVELEPQALSPKLQGPLAERARRAAAKAGGKNGVAAGKPTSPALAPAPAASEKPHVYVPLDGK